MKNLISVSGLKGSGKDTFADIFRSKTGNSMGPTWEVKRFSGKLKKIASDLTGYPQSYFESQQFKSQIMPGWDMTGREFLQKIGQGLRDTVHPDIWVKSLMREIDLLSDHNKIIITDSRYLNELRELKQRGAICVRINRESCPDNDPHPSENEWKHFDYDTIIDNNGSLELFIWEIERFINYYEI